MSQGALQFGGEWTVQKLERLRKYLEAYTTALKNKQFHLVYIDAFAGTGYCSPAKEQDDEPILFPEEAPEERESYLKGSARIALEIKNPFNEYVFIELNRSNCAELQKLRGEYPHLADRIRLIRGDANKHVRETTQRDWTKQRAVMFLDPYATEVEWKTVQAVSQTRAIDMWFLFPLMAVNRLLRRDGSIKQAERDRLNTVFGSSDWYDAFYSEAENLQLFGGEPDTQKTADFGAIRDYLQERLRREFAGVAHNPLVLRNSCNHPLFLLCFAVSSENARARKLALDIAEYILEH